jgi:mannose-6-phosphate isomerase-like protein (cupin superfamily)
MVVGPGRGEVVGDSPERRVEILSDHTALHATWSRFAPGRDGADLHVHRRHTDVFYVLAGELTLRLGIEDRAVVAPAGSVVRVPPLVVHGFRNAGSAELRYLNFHAPGTGFADYMRGLRDGRRVVYDQEPPPAEGRRPPSEASIGPPPVESPEITITEVRGVPDDLQFGYVLEGELEGSWIQVEPGEPPPIAGDVRLLAVSVP